MQRKVGDTIDIRVKIKEVIQREDATYYLVGCRGTFYNTMIIRADEELV